MKILVVDDYLPMLEILTHFLKAWQHLSATTDNVNEIENLVDSFRPDLIILDHGVGTVSADRIMQRINRPEMPYILISGQPVMNCNGSGRIVGMLHKPFRFDDMRALIQKTECVCN